MMPINLARTALGCVGVATAGRACGRFVYVYPESLQDFWVICLEGPSADFTVSGFDFSFENPGIDTTTLEGLVDSWGVIWLAGEAERVIERRFFDIRATLDSEGQMQGRSWWERGD